MIRIFCKSQNLKSIFLLNKTFSSGAICRSQPTNNNQIIENIKNGIKHLRIYDEIDLLPADLDWEYLLDTKNIEAIDRNNKDRKGFGDINEVVS